MAAEKKMMHPDDFLKELKQIGLEIKAEELTPEGRTAILEQLNKMEALLLDLKKQFSENNTPNEVKV
jgi:hypothetical protein